MIGTIDCKLHASNPAFPLDPIKSFINSPSNVRIRNVPRSIGTWNITEVFFTINYPDNSIKTTNCVLTGGVYVGTVEGSTVSGKTPYGFTIYANGVDENENPVNGYVLGKGDVYVFNDCGNLMPTGTKYTVKLNDELPQHPSKGDAYFNGNMFLLYDGVEWKEVGGSESGVISVNGILPDENGNVPLGKLVKSVNNLLPDNYGNVEVSVDTTKKLVNEDGTKYVDGNLDVYENSGTEEVPVWEKTGELATKDEVQDIVKTPTPKVLPDYLYQLNFDSDYEAEGKAWREQNFENIDIGGCSSVRKNNWVGRNYDYTYSDAATFVIKLPNRVVGAGTKYGSVGIATLGKNLTKKMVESGNYTDLYKALPGMTTDGINEKGLQVAIHLVPSDTTKDAGWTGNSMDAFGAVRYVLDTFDNSEQAATWISQNVYLPDKYVTETGYSVQYIVSGYNQNTYIVQDGVVYDYGETTGALTNYRLYDAGSLTPEFDRSIIGTYDPYGQGVERMSLIQNGLETLYTSDDISLLMEQLYFTNAYSPVTSNPWYSEFVNKEKGRTLLSPDEDFTAPLAIGRLAYNVRDRFNPSHVEYEGETYDVTTWQTVHTVVYNLENKTLTVRVQEGDEEYTFKSEAGSIGDLPEIPTKTSDLINDSGFITSEDIPAIPTKTSDLTNDSNFITAADIPTIPTKTSDLTNDSGFITSAAVPTKTSDLTNDSGFITSSDLPTVPTKTSDLINDSGFIDEQGVEKVYNNTKQQYLDSNGEHYHYSSDYGEWTFKVTPEFTAEGELEMEEERTESEYVYTLKFIKQDSSFLILQTSRRTQPLTQFGYSNIDVGDGVMHIVDGKREGIGWNKDWQLAKTTDIPTKVSELTNDVPYANKNNVDNKFEEVDLAIDGLATGYSEITEKIPTQASRQNQLADKAFVNSSIATGTGTFKGTFNSTTELPTTGVNVNDYAFVISTDTQGNTVYNRYKYSTEWIFEYALNNSSFTAVQWATINGGPYAKPEDIPTVPTKTSDLTNDSGFITSSDIPTIPSKTSDLTNDSGFITSSDVPTKTSDLTNDSGFITNTVQGLPFSVKNEAGTTTYFSASSNGVYKNGKLIATVDQIKSPYYTFTYDEQTMDGAFLLPNNIDVISYAESTDWVITLGMDIATDPLPEGKVFDTVLFIENLSVLPTSVSVDVDMEITPTLYGDSFDVIDEINVPYMLTFTVLRKTSSQAIVFMKIQKLEAPSV